MRDVSRGFYESRGRLGWIERYRQRAYLASLPENWRELVEYLVWFWAWEPRVVMDMTITEMVRWVEAARRLGPRVVQAVLVRAAD